MSVDITFEYHSTSVDNEAGVASGWRDPPLSNKGREQAKELGERCQGEQIHAVFCSDLRRAVETAEIAFAAFPIHPDRRLRESNYGTMTGAPPPEIDADRPNRIDAPFPEGESLRDVVARVSDFIGDLARDWNGKHVVVIGHRATLLAFEHLLGGVSMEEAAAASFEWQPGWRFILEA